MIKLVTNFNADQRGGHSWTYYLTTSSDVSNGFDTKFGWGCRVPYLTRVLPELVYLYVLSYCTVLFLLVLLTSYFLVVLLPVLFLVQVLSFLFVGVLKQYKIYTIMILGELFSPIYSVKLLTCGKSPK